MSYQILPEGMFFTENNLQMKVLLRDPEIPYSLHSHEFYELVVVVSGQGTHLFKGGEQPIGEGSVLFIRPGVFHGYDRINNLRLYNILLGKDVLSRDISDLSEMPGFREFFMQTGENIPICKLTGYQLSEVIFLLREIKKESEQAGFAKGSATMTYAKLLQLVIQIARIYTPRPQLSSRFPYERLTPIMEFMEQNLNRTLTLEELVEVANMSSSTLNRQFKTITGWSPVEFHIHRRIAYACTLILKRKMTMEQISEATGFSDANYFSRQFRSHMGMSPIQYRKVWTEPMQ
ncbi:AraC family transcriptional regulator [Sphaerochaeta sp. PS]|uniref:AraC family transcriptional regulator n=1 Tax=Sphaerochaeta sp. PS TaxID=3076336 RepID=UPI0028A33CF2|nr:AraC family transcriptional regulator [Sphaerochaeta sp. PS]MDT4761272.1 AraC family transcriptional regulator [Sphaerochaeta sp. PS]